MRLCLEKNQGSPSLPISYYIPCYIRTFALQFSYIFDDKSIYFYIQAPKYFYTCRFEFDFVTVPFSKFDWFDDFLQALWAAIKGS
jgi:hypothetical protein